MIFSRLPASIFRFVFECWFWIEQDFMSKIKKQTLHFKLLIKEDTWMNPFHFGNYVNKGNKIKSGYNKGKVSISVHFCSL